MRRPSGHPAEQRTAKRWIPRQPKGRAGGPHPWDVERRNDYTVAMRPPPRVSQASCQTPSRASFCDAMRCPKRTTDIGLRPTPAARHRMMYSAPMASSTTLLPHEGPGRNVTTPDEMGIPFTSREYVFSQQSRLAAARRLGAIAVCPTFETPHALIARIVRREHVVAQWRGAHIQEHCRHL